MNNSILTVYKSPFEKIRISFNNSGGYVLADIPSIQYDILLSGGVEWNMMFENDFTSKYNCPCLLYDESEPTITNNNITFINKNINGYNDDSNTNLENEITQYNSIFIKLNIEGLEYPWIESLSMDQLSKIEQMVIEFHHPFSKSNVIEKINQTHYLIHFHGNNCCGVYKNRGINIPNIFQCTYLNKKYITSPELNTDVIPGPLDMATIGGDDIMIDYPPFVN